MAGFFVSFFQMFFKFKLIRGMVVFTLVLATLNYLNTFVLSTFTNFVMPDAMVRLWNFFDMNNNVGIVISAFETRFIVNLVLKFGASYLEG
jgi:hypothetical protein